MCRGRAVKSTRLKLWCASDQQSVDTCVLKQNTVASFFGYKAVGPVCFVTPVKEPSALIVKSRGTFALV